MLFSSNKENDSNKANIMASTVTTANRSMIGGAEIKSGNEFLEENLQNISIKSENPVQTVRVLLFLV